MVWVSADRALSFGCLVQACTQPLLSCSIALSSVAPPYFDRLSHPQVLMASLASSAGAFLRLDTFSFVNIKRERKEV